MRRRGKSKRFKKQRGGQVAKAMVTTLAGSSAASYLDATGREARFNSPSGVVVGAGGNLYVSDTLNNRIRIITPGGVVSTLAGSSWGFQDGPGTSAKFANPEGVAVDAAGNVYVADMLNHRIRIITPDGIVSTFAGSGFGGYGDGIAASASFTHPMGVAVDAAGNVYVADQGNNCIRKIASGQVTTFAGAGFAGRGWTDSIGTLARFDRPYGVAVDTSGIVYVADTYNGRIRKITSNRAVSTLATGFTTPTAVAVDAAGNVYVAEPSNNYIKKITSGVVTIFAGSWGTGFSDGVATNATFSYPKGVAVNALGNVYVTDNNNHSIRVITPPPITTTRGDPGRDAWVAWKRVEPFPASRGGVRRRAKRRITRRKR